MAKKESLYKNIEKDIIESINKGVYKIGDFIPTEMELAKKYGVSRVTVRQATNNLVSNGVLIRNQGRGTEVARIKPKIDRTADIKSFSEEMKELGKVPTSDLVHFEIIKANKEVGERLNINQGELVYYIVRVRKADDDPMVIERSYLSVEDFPDFTFSALKESKYNYYENVKGMKISFSNQVVVPILPDEEICKLLGVSKGKALIKVHNTTYLDNGKVLDYTELILNSDKYQYVSKRHR